MLIDERVQPDHPAFGKRLTWSQESHVITHDVALAAFDAIEHGSGNGCAFANLRAYIEQHAPSEASGDWIQVRSGGRFYPSAPRAEDIYIGDIAHALSMINRFAGHTHYPYSVAQHSVYVSYQVPPEHALTALMHDATEAYLVDIPRPLKKMLPFYYELENRAWRVIAQQFGLPENMPQCVKDADNAVLLAERAALLVATPDAWDIPGEPAPIKITEWHWEQAKCRFLTRMDELVEKQLDQARRDAGTF